MCIVNYLPAEKTNSRRTASLTAAQLRVEIAKGAVRILAPLLLTVSAALAADPTSDIVKPPNVSLSYGDACDDRQNRRIAVENTHPYRTAQVTVKWHASGGKELQEKFLVSPGEIVSVGCGMEGSIVEAVLADF